MSSQNPRSPASRRRIAGERRPARGGDPAGPAPEVEQDQVDDTREVPAPAEPPPTVEPAPAADAPERPSRRTGRAPSWLVVGVLGALALVLVVTAAVLGLGVWSYGEVRSNDQVDEATRTGPSVAERAAATILSYDYKSLDADESAAEKYMTASYRKEYAATFARLVRPNAGKLRANVKAEVKASGVSHADPDRVNVLLYVDQTTLSTANSGEPQQALNRVMLSMKREHGSWLVDNITSY